MWSDITDPPWDIIADVNLKGASLCCRRAFRPDHAPSHGSIVTLSSVHAKRGAPNALHCATTKAGIPVRATVLGNQILQRRGRPGDIANVVNLSSAPTAP